LGLLSWVSTVGDALNHRSALEGDGLGWNASTIESGVQPAALGLASECNCDLTVEAISGGIEVIDQMADEWRRFLEGVENDSPYWRPEWISAALRAFSPTIKLVVVTVRRQGELCAILPLVEERGRFAGLPARKLRAPMTTHGVGVDILFADCGVQPDKLVRAIWQFFREKRGWDVLELPSVMQDAAIEQLTDLARNEGLLAGGWCLPVIAFFSMEPGLNPGKELEKYPRHPKLRAKVRQREAKLAAMGTVRLSRVERAGATELQRFYAMEAAGWKGREKSAIVSDARNRQFFDEVVAEAERLGYLCLYTLELDGKPIAAHIGFTYRGRYWAAKSTYDENYRDYAPGHLIVKAILRDLVERGISEYVMGIREDWKLEWTQDVRRRSYQCIFGRGLWPRVLYAARFPLRRKASEIKVLGRSIPAYARRILLPA
jgi:CelD/BcsL family acetyltransferase involved in cellulose biosynthesis